MNEYNPSLVLTTCPRIYNIVGYKQIPKQTVWVCDVTQTRRDRTAFTLCLHRALQLRSTFVDACHEYNADDDDDDDAYDDDERVIRRGGHHHAESRRCSSTTRVRLHADDAR